MLISKTSKRNIILFCCAFLLCGILHIALYGVDLTDCFATIFCCILTILWAGTIQKRIVDGRLRRLMLLLAASFLFHFFLQFLRYEIVPDDNDFRRHLWYAMYIPIVAQPIICYYIASSIYREKNAPMPRFGLLLIAVGAAIVFGYLQTICTSFSRPSRAALWKTTGRRSAVGFSTRRSSSSTVFTHYPS